MSELNLSLYDLDQQLTELWAMREQVEDQILTAQAEGDLPETIARLNDEAVVLEEAMVLYFEALPRKVDSTADAWQILDRLCAEPKERKVDGNIVTIRCELDREIDRLKDRRDAMRKRLESLKTRVQFVMEGMAWPEGKPRKLEGARHTIYLKANGGRPGVEITDEALVPDELCTVSVTMPADIWRRVSISLAAFTDSEDVFTRMISSVRSAPSLTLIAEALGKPCAKCRGTGNWHEIGADNALCADCGGSGKQSVPGARLKPVGQHVEVR